LLALSGRGSSAFWRRTLFSFCSPEPGRAGEMQSTAFRPPLTDCTGVVTIPVLQLFGQLGAGPTHPRPEGRNNVRPEGPSRKPPCNSQYTSGKPKLFTPRWRPRYRLFAMASAERKPRTAFRSTSGRKLRKQRAEPCRRGNSKNARCRSPVSVSNLPARLPFVFKPQEPHGRAHSAAALPQLRQAAPRRRIPPLLKRRWLSV
jgi:hypothetical protein